MKSIEFSYREGEPLDHSIEPPVIPEKFRLSVRAVEGYFLTTRKRWLAQFESDDPDRQRWRAALDTHLSLEEFRRLAFPLLFHPMLGRELPTTFEGAGRTLVHALAQILYPPQVCPQRDPEQTFAFIRDFFSPAPPEGIRGQFLDLYKNFCYRDEESGKPLLSLPEEEKKPPKVLIRDPNQENVLLFLAAWQGFFIDAPESTEKFLKEWRPFYDYFYDKHPEFITQIGIAATHYLIGLDAYRHMDPVSMEKSDLYASRFLRNTLNLIPCLEEKGRPDLWKNYLYLALASPHFGDEKAQFPMDDLEQVFVELKALSRFKKPIQQGLISLAQFVLFYLGKKVRFGSAPPMDSPTTEDSTVYVSDMWRTISQGLSSFPPERGRKILQIPMSFPHLRKHALVLLKHHARIEESFPTENRVDGLLNYLWSLRHHLNTPSPVMGELIRCFSEGGPTGIPQEGLLFFLAVGQDVFIVLRERGLPYLKLGELNPSLAQTLRDDRETFLNLIEIGKEMGYHFLSINYPDSRSFDLVLQAIFERYLICCNTPIGEEFIQGLTPLLEATQILFSPDRQATVEEQKQVEAILLEYLELAKDPANESLCVTGRRLALRVRALFELSRTPLLPSGEEDSFLPTLPFHSALKSVLGGVLEDRVAFWQDLMDLDETAPEWLRHAHSTTRLAANSGAVVIALGLAPQFRDDFPELFTIASELKMPEFSPMDFSSLIEGVESVSKSEFQALRACFQKARVWVAHWIQEKRKQFVGLMPIGSKLQSNTTISSEKAQLFLKIMGFDSRLSAFHLKHRQQCFTLPATPTAFEQRLLHLMPQILGLVQGGDLQMTMLGRWPDHQRHKNHYLRFQPGQAGIVGASLLLATEVGITYAPGAFTSTNASETGHRFMLYDMGVVNKNMPYCLEEAKGRTDVLGRVASDLWLYQVLGTFASYATYEGSAAYHPAFKEAMGAYSAAFVQRLRRTERLDMTLTSSGWVFDSKNAIDPLEYHEVMIQQFTEAWKAHPELRRDVRELIHTTLLKPLQAQRDLIVADNPEAYQDLLEY